jgi:D-alanine-D-alanine ligase-like ATP-grasp enzyme
MDRLRIGILFGGMCSEREVSLNSGRNVYDNLDRERYEPVPLFMDGEGRLWLLPWQLVSQNTTVDISERAEKEAERVPYEDLRKKIDFAFICLHGKYGDDGCIQGLLELLRIPYTGSGVLASAVGMDKALQQKILEAEGIEVPASLAVSGEEWAEDREGVEKRIEETFGFPVVVKPTREGSSVGVAIVGDRASLQSGMEQALAWDASVLVEEYLDGTEFPPSSWRMAPPGSCRSRKSGPERLFHVRRQVHARPVPEVHPPENHSEGNDGADPGGSPQGLPRPRVPVLRPDGRLRDEGRAGSHHRPQFLLRDGPVVFFLRAGGGGGDASFHDPHGADRGGEDDSREEAGAAVRGAGGTRSGRGCAGGLRKRSLQGCQMSLYLTPAKPVSKEGRP